MYTEKVLVYTFVNKYCVKHLSSIMSETKNVCVPHYSCHFVRFTLSMVHTVMRKLLCLNHDINGNF